MRLIDADALKKLAEDHGFGFADFQAIDNAPTIDAVPVVRCRECKHRETVDCPMCHEEYHFDEDDGGDYSLWTRMVDPNGFCSCGERKEGADNG